ncbi:BatD family protein [Aquimarina algicola]|uniref:DUF4381 domain-containing protein n=1 Tax=Aquimarina algicola TaxID=2589995 RepID=A0A504J920_9FLAO|nr:BatD family protein [Aquimarina algicola]TPN84063.1 DUF4381 domain-containing protein [Aquimarina algicola]
MKDYKQELKYISIFLKPQSLFLWALLSFWSITSSAQVSATVDSTDIKIGEEIRYKMQVESDSTQMVVFPEGQTFMPLEMIDSRKIDTSRNGKKIQLIKEYALTQFDSGSYTIPRQKVMVGDQVFFTDSIKVEVRDVLVDTTKQKMFAIKPLVDVDPKTTFNWKKIILIVGIIFLVLLVIGAIVFLLLRRKKKIDARKNKLPPYERAILALQKIDESHLLEKDSHKEYYSQLSDTARQYIDEEIYDHAMESTTDELIAKLDEEIRSGSLNLDIATVEELKKVLKTADMAKFAKSKPDKITARADRNVIEQVIHKTKEAIPEPTEEELLADEEYRKQKARKKKRKQIILGSVGVFLLLVGTWVGLGWFYGFDVLKDNIFGHPTKKLAESEWITSAYGSPPITITTPKVLIRKSVKLTEEEKNSIFKSENTFEYGTLSDNVFIKISSQTVDLPEKDINETISKIVAREEDNIISYFEELGAKNITVKSEEYETLNGVEGRKVFGNFKLKKPKTKDEQKYDYVMLMLGYGGFQQITVVYDTQDRYAKDMVERIINSVELKNAE